MVAVNPIEDSSPQATPLWATKKAGRMGSVLKYPRSIALKAIQQQEG
jgi:hypothetical protein